MSGWRDRYTPRHQVAEAVLTAGVPLCPRFKGIWAFSTDTERAYGQSCGRWDCDHCSKWKRACARLALGYGIDSAIRQGERVRFITLTDSSGNMEVAAWSAAWRRLAQRLGTSRKGRRGRAASGRWIWKQRPRPAYLREFAVVLEAHRSGALHLHGLLLGAYIPQAWLPTQAAEAGLVAHPESHGDRVMWIRWPAT